MARENPYVDKDIKEYVFEEYGTITYAVTVKAKSEGEAWEKFHCGDHESYEETDYSAADYRLIHNPEGYNKHLSSSVNSEEEGFQEQRIRLERD